jgi:Domain of unknown function (DUF4166)
MQPSPFEQLLGAEFARLPAAVRQVHAARAPLRTAGRADVTAATSAMARLVCWFAGLPKPGRAIETAVVFTSDGKGGEHWQRQFGERRYQSTIVAGNGRDAGLLVERFGLFDLKFRLTPRDDGLHWALAGGRFVGLPLPRWSVPYVDGLESTDGARFTFDIDVTFPVIGWLVHYRGWLIPQDHGSGLDHAGG